MLKYYRISQCDMAVQEAGELSGVGSAKPPGTTDQDEDEEGALPSAQDPAGQPEAPAHFTPDVAKR